MRWQMFRAKYLFPLEGQLLDWIFRQVCYSLQSKVSIFSGLVKRQVAGAGWFASFWTKKKGRTDHVDGGNFHSVEKSIKFCVFCLNNKEFKLEVISTMS